MAGEWRTAWKRCRAVLLAVLFLGGQYGPPVVDMLVSHSGGTVQTHIEKSQDQACHAERCMLGYVGPTAHAAVVAAPLARLSMPTTVRGDAAPRLIAARSFLVSLPDTRAPPFASA